MIVNVINGQSTGISESAADNVFAGMSLAEACGQLQANVSDILNEMNMGILLNEHLYLRENGTDIQYVDESAADLKNKIVGAIDNVIKQVSGLWDKLITWVQDRLEDFRLAIARSGFDKKKAEAAKRTPVASCNVKWIGKEVMDKAIKDIMETSDLEGKLAKYDFKGIVTDKKSLSAEEVEYAYTVVFDTNRSILGDIRASKAAAIKKLNDLKSGAKKADDAEKVKKVNAASRRVSKQTSLAIKVYHANVNGCAQAMKAAVAPAQAAAKAEKSAAHKEKRDALYAKTPMGKKAAAKKAKEDADIDELNNYYPTPESAIFTDDRFFKV